MSSPDPEAAVREAACCAHIQVRYFTRDNGDGTVSGYWECAICPERFFPSARLDALRAERDEAQTTLAFLADRFNEAIRESGGREVERYLEFGAMRDGFSAVMDGLGRRIARLLREADAAHARGFAEARESHPSMDG